MQEQGNIPDRNPVMFEDYPDIMDVKDLQRALKIGKTAAYTMLDSGEIQNFRIGRAYKIPKISLIQFVLKGEKSGAQNPTV